MNEYKVSFVTFLVLEAIEKHLPFLLHTGSTTFSKGFEETLPVCNKKVSFRNIL